MDVHGGNENLLVAEEGLIDALQNARTSVDLPATEAAILNVFLSLTVLELVWYS